MITALYAIIINSQEKKFDDSPWRWCLSICIVIGQLEAVMVDFYIICKIIN